MTTIWVTNPNLGSIPENEPYDLNLETYDTSGSVTYTVISGSLPGNLILASNGTIYGNTAYVNNYSTSNFTVRATNADSQVTDRTFTLTVVSPVPPNLTPNSGTLTSTIEGDYYSQVFSLDDPNILDTTTFLIDAGTIPPGLSLSSNGTLSGYAHPITTNTNYEFTVRATDGGKIDQNDYTLQVYSRSSLTADSTEYTADNVSIITADLSNLINPILLDSGFIGNVTERDTFAYKLQGYDFDGDDLTYNLVSGSLPSDFTFNANSGWITGVVPSVPRASVTYNFAANVTKRSDASFSSNTTSYSLTVLGQINDSVVWNTDTNVGSIYNGSISEFYIDATTTNGTELLYTVVTNVTYDPITFEANRPLNFGLVSYGTLPPGLEILTDGTISGRVTFQTESNVDTYVFTVAANDSTGLVYGQKEFSIDVVRRDERPYENLYLTLLAPREQREIYANVLNNTDTIPPDYVYRQYDPWFGKNNLRKVLFMTGLDPDNISTYITALQQNHYNKTLNFGELKTAIATDDNFNPVYEVVYLELIDEQVNAAGLGPNASISWPTNSVGVSTVYPNSFPNMTNRLADVVGYQNRGILPRWMTSRQPNGTVLGFTRALVLCYTKPGYSPEVAYRIQQTLTDFNMIQFSVDRYEYDDILSNNFIKDPVTGTGNITANTTSTSVTGNSTIFSNELQIGSTLYVSNVAIGNVANISSNTTLTLYANASTNVANLSYTYNNSFVVISYTEGTGYISANTSSNIVTGNTANISGSGTITGIEGNAVVLGNGTAFSSELIVGSNVFVSGNSIGAVRSIISANRLVLDVPITANITSSAYTAEGVRTKFIEELHVSDVLVNSSNVVIGIVETITNNSSLILTTNASANITDAVFSHTTRDPYTTPGEGDKYLKFPQFGVI